MALHLEDIEQIDETNAQELVKDFSMQEIKDATFQMEHNKTSGPDGYVLSFIKILGSHQQRPEKNSGRFS